MEISRSVPKRSDSSKSHGGFASRKSLYDGVFGSRRKIGIPVQAPRCEEYSEIFGAFHASRSSSIPVLHIPVVAGDSGLHFDVRGPGPDYAEVFGKVGGSAFAVSFEDVFRHDVPLSSMQSGLIAEELDPLGRSDKNNRSTNGDARQLNCRSKQFSASHSSLSGRHKELVCSKASHISSTHEPGYDLVYYNSPVSSNGVDQPCLMPAVFGVGCPVVESHGRVKHHEKHLQDHTQFSSSQRWEVDFQPSEKHGNPTSMMKKPFITISDVHLRTKPSKLPPPSRAPPGFEFKKSDNEMVFLDVEVDETCKQRENEFVKVVHTLDSNEGKDFLDQKSNIPAIVSSFEGEEFFNSCAQEGAISEPLDEYGQFLRKCSQKAMFHHSHTTHNSTKSVTWREMEDYFEVTEKKVCKHHVIAVEDYGVSHPRDTYQHQKETKIQEFAEMNQAGEANDHIVWDYDPPKRTPRTSSNVDTGFHNLKLDQLFCEENSKENLQGKLHPFEKSVKVEILDGETGPLVGTEKDVGVHVWEGLINWISDTNLQKEECQKGPTVVEKSKHKKGEENTFILEDGRQIPHKIMGHKKNGTTVAQCAHSTGTLSESSEENSSESTMGDTLEEASNYEEPKPVLEKNFNDYTGDPCQLKGNQQVIFETKELYEHPEETGALQKTVHRIEVSKATSPREKDLLMPFEKEMSVTLYMVREVNNEEKFSNEENVDLNLLHDGKDKEHDVYLQKEDKPQIHEACVMARKTSESPCVSELVMVDSNIVKDKTSSAAGISIGREKIYSAKDGVIARSIDIRKSPAPRTVMKECQENEKKIENDSTVLENNNATACPTRSAMDQKSERKDRNVRNNVIARDLVSVTTVVGESELINDYKRKMEEEMERQREREKDRMGVSRATLEAHTRPYSESLERVTLERANAEMKERTSTDRVGLEKSSAETWPKPDQVAAKSAINGAQLWVSEKTFSEKVLDSQSHVDKSFADRRSASAKYGDSSYSSLPPDLHFQSAGAWGFPSEHEGADGESFQRCKARLERYRRTEDRVANALAEKNKRDLQVQREKEERNKVAVGLDAEIKRWSNGKEGNLRALLSTLQYILGPESGWQPISLTEVVTPAAVKKAYRKATLCVHPDKLQQRGATVHQKYICEKVFDLLKEAWNKFNSVEY